MELEFSADQEELRNSIRSVLESTCPIGLVREVVEKGTGVERLWATQVELDWPALTVPSSCGGIGLGYLELTVLAEELGRSIAPGPLFATVSQFVPLVRECGSEEQQAGLLAAVATGERTGTVAVAEAGGGWDLSKITASAEKDGNNWRLRGTKRWVLDGDRADEIAVIARRADNGELAVFVVPGTDLPASAMKALDGSRPLAAVELDGCLVPAKRCLEGTEEGIRRAYEEATVAMAVETVGTCQSIFDIALQYAKDRQQFGVPIGTFQAVKHKFADMLVAVERARALAYFAAATIAEDDERRPLAVAMAKAASGDCQELLAQEGIQCLGGIGYTWEHDMHLYVKRAKTNGALLGGRAAHRERVAELIGL
ncbi:MAG TPA: acyl-CoA dehydrogenase family protein [Acidimicrobiales bacterium]|nr:acyl-CoA dehydrogenase family protein [Acidimicrobiales bacterium]